MSRRLTIQEYVRWSDVDAAGILCYGAFVRFVEIAETELFRAAGMPYGKVFDELGCWLPRVRFQCDFHVPARLDERLAVSAFVAALGNTSIRLSFTVDNERAQRVADFTLVLVCTDRSSFEKRPLPPALREALTPFVA